MYFGDISKLLYAVSESFSEKSARSYSVKSLQYLISGVHALRIQEMHDTFRSVCLKPDKQSHGSYKYKENDQDIFFIHRNTLSVTQKRTSARLLQASIIERCA